MHKKLFLLVFVLKHYGLFRNVCKNSVIAVEETKLYFIICVCFQKSRVFYN